MSPSIRLWLLLGGVILASLLFMTLNVRAGWAFTLPFRGEKLLGLLLVAYCIAISTVLFQTLTHNRILSPGIMGFDFLYLLLQSLMVYSFGTVFFSQISPSLKWIGEVLVMVGVMCLLFYWLFIRQQRHLHVLVLVGIILGTLFRSLNAMIARLMDPVEFDLLQDVMFASFNQMDSALLGVSALMALLVSVLGWRYRHALDVLALGSDQA
nr:iron chelate uptake ABC transporter family permease subunit [Nitrincola nitratireducens]